MLGWDIDSRVQLEPRHRGSAAHAAAVPERRARPPARRCACSRSPGTSRCCYTLEREPLPAYRFAWNAHPRLAFQLDDAHPFSGSHHQKIVVVDDALAFTGGLDLTIRRWDTPAHQADEPAPRRSGRPPLPARPRHSDDGRRRGGRRAGRAGARALARGHGRGAGDARVPRPRPPPICGPRRRSPTCVTRRSASPARCRAFRDAPAVQEVADLCARAVDRLGAPLHLHREPVPDVGGHRRRAGAPAGRARRARGGRRAPARGARLAGAELDGRHARAPAAAPARQPTVTAACACSSRRSPPSSRAA